MKFWTYQKKYKNHLQLMNQLVPVIKTVSTYAVKNNSK
jgi:hypothetical protein